MLTLVHICAHSKLLQIHTGVFSWLLNKPLKKRHLPLSKESGGSRILLSQTNLSLIYALDQFKLMQCISKEVEMVFLSLHETVKNSSV
jgi:hypothetical protein